MSALHFWLHSNCTWMPTIVFVKITTKNSIFKIFPRNFPYFVINMLYEIFSFVRKYLPFIFNYVVILFVCLSFYLRFSKIIFNFISYHMKSSIISYICQIQIFSSTRKYLHFLFQLYSNCIWMCIIESEFFFSEKIFSFINYLKLSSILSYIW